MTSDEEKHSLREFRFSFLLFPAVSYEEAWQKKREDAKESSMEKSLVYSNATLSKMSRETCLCAWGIHLGERISLSFSVSISRLSLASHLSPPMLFLCLSPRLYIFQNTNDAARENPPGSNPRVPTVTCKVSASCANSCRFVPTSKVPH